MSSVEDSVRAFLDRLERGEASVEERSLADRLSWWAAGWKARGASAPSGIELPATRVEETIDARVPASKLTAGGLSVEVVASDAVTASGKKKQRRVVPDPEASVVSVAREQVKRALPGPEDVAAVLAPPEPWIAIPNHPSPHDAKLATTIEGFAGRWVEIDCSGLTRYRAHWLAQKIGGPKPSVAFRPVGRFEAHQDRGRLVARLVVGPPKAAKKAGLSVAQRNGRVSYADRFSAARMNAPRDAVAVLIPPVPLDVRKADGKARGATKEERARGLEADSAFAAEIRSYGGKWVEIEVSEYNRSFPPNLAQKIAGLGLGFKPWGTFEATVKGGRLYARYVGEQS